MTHPLAPQPPNTLGDQGRTVGEPRDLAETLLQATLDAVPDGVLVVTADGRVSHCSARFREMWAIPEPLAAGARDRDILEWMVPQVDDPRPLLALLAEEPCAESPVVVAITLRDGRRYERRTRLIASNGSRHGRACFFRDVTEARRAEEARLTRLRASEEQYRILFERSADATLVIEDDTFVDCNEATVRLLGCSRKEDLLRTHPSELSPDRQPDGRCSREKAAEMMAIARERGSHRFDWDHRRADGTLLPVEVSLTAIPVADRTILHVVWRDITIRRRAEAAKELLEAQLRESQKMEAVGQLAGGIAHDFNNILTAILGNVELAQETLDRLLPESGPLKQRLHQIQCSGQRASTLTRQLLAFSRRQVSQPEVLDLNRVMTDMEVLLTRLLGEDIALETRLDPTLAAVRVDAGHLEQVVMNLAVNARDAMPRGGSLTLETGCTVLEGDYLKRHPDACPGLHVVLTVRDTGIGMDAATIEHVFEPFYTTKAVGAGTGLGLATVYGIIRQAGGHVTVHSEPDRGATFRVYLPAVDAPLTGSQTRDTGHSAPTGAETVLVCEDNENVRHVAARFLASAGYAVLSAASGRQALQLATDHGGAIDLLVTDVIMPDMNGRQLAERLSAARRDTKILFISGYTASVIAQHGIIPGGVALLEKPFKRDDLLKRVRNVLDGD